MENYQGDLTDILRASSSNGGLGQTLPSVNISRVSNWEFTSSSSSDNNNIIRGNNNNNNNNTFGDPFVNMRDPLLHELDNVVSSSSSSKYFVHPNSTDHTNFSGANSSSSCNNNNNLFDNTNSSSCNVFSRIQISPTTTINKFPVSPCDSPVLSAASPRGFNKISPMVSIDMSSKNCLVDNTGQVQISSPRNLGIKRRKSQAKKVVCIPAPAAANSRPSGEVVPSDLWAWRKYGQKPIKGSPYPRGYYRCSSSKGCSARKQVERSRTDPNMLVITYTSEHNHPWPTQRNALAGSTRSQPPKNMTSTGLKTSPTRKTTSLNAKEEHKESSNDTLSPPITTAVKEEINEDSIHEKQIMEMNDGTRNDPFNEGFANYRPVLPDSNHSEDFFAELGEIDADPIHLMFSQVGFDWSVDNNNNSINNSNHNNVSFDQEPKTGL